MPGFTTCPASGGLFTVTRDTGLFRIDHAGRYTFVNRVMERVLQLPREAILGRSWCQIMPDQTERETRRAIVCRVLNGETIVWPNFQGRCGTSLALFMPDRDASGHIVACVGIVKAFWPQP